MIFPHGSPHRWWEPDWLCLSLFSRWGDSRPVRLSACDRPLCQRIQGVSQWVCLSSYPSSIPSPPTSATLVYAVWGVVASHVHFPPRVSSIQTWVGVGHLGKRESQGESASHSWFKQQRGKKDPWILKKVRERPQSGRVLSVASASCSATHKCDIAGQVCAEAAAAVSVYECARERVRVALSCCENCAVYSWCLCTLSALLHNQQLKYQTSRREPETQEKRFLQLPWQPIQNARDAPHQKFLGNGLERCRHWKRVWSSVEERRSLKMGFLKWRVFVLGCYSLIKEHAAEVGPMEACGEEKTH